MISLTGWPSKWSACKKMKMNVENTLSCLLAAVGNNSETVLKVEVFGKLCDNFIDMCDNRTVFRCYLIKL